MTGATDGRLKAISTLLLLAALAAPAAGQTGTQPRVWTAVSVRGDLGHGSSWASDSIVRAREGASTLDVLAQQVIVSRAVTTRSAIGLGYAYGAVFPDGRSLIEHRFLQQYTWSQGSGRRVSHRSRLEERFVTGQSHVLLRARQQVRLMWPLAVRGGLQGVVSEEIFVQVTSTPRAPRGIEGNRVFVGVARLMTPRTRVEAGYVNVYARSGSPRDRRSHVLSATVLVSM